MRRAKGRAGTAGLLGGLLILLAGTIEAAPPGASTLIAPTGVVGGSALTFAWQAVPAATFYYLQVNDATASPRLVLWFPAGQACPAGTATCLVTLMTGFAAGPVTWWVQTWNSDGFGPWSASITFTLNYLPGAWSQTLPAADRFQLVMGGQAVLDRETGLVWDRAPNMALLQWGVANLHCAVRRLGSRLGWRLPTREEMSTLVDLQVTAPALPPGHPFSNIVLTDNYWSASALMDGSGGYLNPADQVLVVNFSYVGEVVLSDKTQSNRAWCVRGGYGYDRTN